MPRVPHGFQSPLLQRLNKPNFDYRCVPGGLWALGFNIFIEHFMKRDIKAPGVTKRPMISIELGEYELTGDL